MITRTHLWVLALWTGGFLFAQLFQHERTIPLGYAASVLAGWYFLPAACRALRAEGRRP